MVDLAGFEQFIQERKSKLRSIARRTGNEQTVEDLQNEAWLTAYDISNKKNIKMDFADREFQDLVLAWLYQRFVVYTEKKVRHSHRFEHQSEQTREGVASLSLLERLATDVEQEPLAELIAEETEHDGSQDLKHSESPAAAYVLLLQRFRYDMKALARYLLISPSHCYRCYRKVLYLAENQNPLPVVAASGHESKAFGPWRKFKIQRRPVQLELELGGPQVSWL